MLGRDAGEERELKCHNREERSPRGDCQGPGGQRLDLE